MMRVVLKPVVRFGRFVGRPWPRLGNNSRRQTLYEICELVIIESMRRSVDAIIYMRRSARNLKQYRKCTGYGTRISGEEGK